MNGHTARKQANAVKDRCCEHILWCGACGTFADIENVGHDENSKDSGLGGNQPEHPNVSARGTLPTYRLLLQRYVCRIHSYFQSGSAGCFKSQSGRRLLTSGMEAKL